MKKFQVGEATLLALKSFPGLVLATALGLGAAARGQEAPAKSSAEPARRLSFGGADSLAGWTVTGDAGVDAAKSREGKGGSLRVGPGSKAVLKLRDPDASGKFELWVFDDGTVPGNAKVSRVGPRWGLVQSDGRVLAAGILYASYLGGNEGYTVTASDGKDWFDQLFWLGVNRAPAGWHKWTFDFDAEDGLRVFHNDHELGAVRVGVRRAEQAEPGQEAEDLRDLEGLVAERGDDPLWPAPRGAQRVRDRQHGPERVRVRAHVAGEAHLVRHVQQRQSLRLLVHGISLARRDGHGREYPAP